MINFSDRENIVKLIELEKISLMSTLDIQKSLNKQILIFIKNFMADVTFSFDINPNDRAFFYLNESTNSLNKSNSNITILNKLLNSLNEINISSENLEEDIKLYNEDFAENINSIFSSTEIIEKFVHEISTTDFSTLSKDLIIENTKKESNIIDSDDLNASYIENTLVISEEQKKVIFPYNINEVKNILLSSNKKYASIQDVIDKEYTKPISDYKFSAISRFKEAYRLVKERENGSNAKALELGFELFFNYNLHPAIITACKSLDELDVYLACLEDNTLEDFHFFEIKYEIPLTVSKHAKNAIV